MQAASASAVEALLALAEELAGNPVASAKCLEAVLQRATSLLPLTEVHARLRLALLLLEHTDNVQAARMHLERGVRGLARQTPLLRLTPAKQVLLASLASCDDLKCRVFSALARCYSLAGAGQKKELGALRSGRELAAANRKRLAATHRRAARALACRPSRRLQPAVDGLGAAL